MEGTEGDPEADPEAAGEPAKKKRRPKGPDPDAFSAFFFLLSQLAGPWFVSMHAYACHVSAHTRSHAELKARSF